MAAVIATGSTATVATAQTVAPFKDRLFAYPAVIETAAGGAFTRYAYLEARDIDERDAVPERRVKPAYVDLSVNRRQRELTLRHDAGTAELYEIGARENARFVVIFVHGRGGDRRLGAADLTFGGNFNRLKNLAAESGATYYVPSMPDFSSGAQSVLAALFAHVADVSPGAPVVLACASMGGEVCWRAARERDLASWLDGLVILGGSSDGGFLQGPAGNLRVPVFFAHGSSDPVYDWRGQKALFDRLVAAGHPTRFALFDTGTHGTPIRMIDWRAALQWILAQ